MRRRSLIVAAATVTFLAVQAFSAADRADAQTGDQEKCINGINKAATKLAATQGKENSGCVKAVGGGKAADLDACITGDAKGKVAGAQAKVTNTANSRCSGPAEPTFGFSDAATTNAAAVSEEQAIVTDMFGSPAQSGVLTDKDGAKCQSGVIKTVEKYAATRAKDFVSCKKDGLKEDTVTDGATLQSECMFPPDAKGKVAKAAAKITAAVAKSCAGIDQATAFAGDCSSSGDLGLCLSQRADCRTCLILNATDAMTAPCDELDNGLVDGSCRQCGNLIVEEPEECDAGAQTQTCELTCTNQVCGDGIVNNLAGETCDDGNLVDGDDCESNCIPSTCGNSAVDAQFGEQCDNGGSNSNTTPDACRENCLNPQCGDGVVDTGEECDDGNLISGDNCSSQCTCGPGSGEAGCQDSNCPASGEIVIYAGTRETPCTTNTDCEVDGAPVGTCDTGLGRCVTVTGLDTGFTGIAHGADVNDRITTRGRLLCPGPFDNLSSEPCGECVVQGLDAENSNLCRCSTDNSVVCSEGFALDPDSCGISGLSCSVDNDCRVCENDSSQSCTTDSDCPGSACLTGLRTPTCLDGQCVGNCECYFGPPLPLSAGNTPACALNKFAQDVTGTANVDLGSGSITTNLKSVVFLGEAITIPCPYCTGDVTANDGVRDGTCVGGEDDGNPCDNNAVNETFPSPTGDGGSLDCFPTIGKNVSGTGLNLQLTQTTGLQTLTAQVPCEFGDAALCHCGLCTGNATLACSDDAFCASLGAGTCAKEGFTSPVDNTCNNDNCVDVGGNQGECVDGPAGQFCDGVTRANGEPFVTCVTNTDCDNTDCGGGAGAGLCGTCQIGANRSCFLPTIEASGSADPQAPVGAAIFCVPKTSSAGINSVAGLPGAGRVINQARAKTFCASNPSQEYIPGTGGCP